MRLGLGLGLGLGGVQGAAVVGVPLALTIAANAAGTLITVTYDQALNAGSVPALGDLGLTGASYAALSGTPAVSGSTLQVSVNPPLNTSDSGVGFSYTRGTHPIQNGTGSNAADLVNAAVSLASVTNPPPALTVTSIAANAAGTQIIITHSLPLDTGSVPDITDYALAGPVLGALSGTPVVSGATVALPVSPPINTADSGVTLSYTGGANKVRDAALHTNAANFSTQAVSLAAVTHAYDPRDEVGNHAVLWVSTESSANYTLAAGMLTAEKNLISGVSIPAITIGAPFEAAGLNSKPCVHPTLSTHMMSSTEAAVLNACKDNASYTLFAYVAYDVAKAIGTFFSFGNSTAANPRRTWGQSNTGNGRQTTVAVNDAAANTSTTSAADNTSTSGKVIMWKNIGGSPGAVTCLINNASADPNALAAAPGTLTPTKFTLNGRSENIVSNQLVGRRTELWFFDSGALGSAAEARICAYLRAKWD